VNEQTGHTSRDRDGQRRGPGGEFLVVLLAVLCCALPLLVATGLIGTLVGYLLRWWWIAILGGGLLVLSIAAWLRRKRAGSAPPGPDAACRS